MMEATVFYLDMLGGEPNVYDRDMNEADLRQRKERMLDKTIADSFPASDPLSSIPNPSDDSFSAADSAVIPASSPIATPQRLQFGFHRTAPILGN